MAAGGSTQRLIRLYLACGTAGCLPALLGQKMSTARRLLKILIDQPLHCEAVREGNQREYRITGTGSYLSLRPEFGCSDVNGVPNGI